MLSTVFAPLAEHPVELYPERLRGEIDALNQQIYDTVNNAVYKAGFATRQAVYEREVRSLFATLDELDARLADRRFLFGPEPLETDWRLFTTLVRFDAVYQIHFKCSLRKLSSTTICGRTRVTCISGRASPRRSISTRSARTTTAPTR